MKALLGSLLLVFVLAGGCAHYNRGCCKKATKECCSSERKGKEDCKGKEGCDVKEKSSQSAEEKKSN